MSTTKQDVILNEIIKDIEIPSSSYQLAQDRYDDLDKWLKDPAKATSAKYNPNVLPQGSFRLGTAIKPWKRDDYDLDLTCKMQQGITKETHSQKELKDLLGNDLENYRIERRIKENLDNKHRCWRLIYRDNLKFHIDVVPCIPEYEETISLMESRMLEAGASEAIAKLLARHTVSITDDTKSSYPIISSDWEISNPEGYAQWFESRMKQAGTLLESIALEEKASRIEDLPTYRWKTPLQKSIQILKRHRDIRFENNKKGKPISIIITTLAAKAYQGEDSFESALRNILSRMGSLVNTQSPRVPNPVNPKEDFADKWPTSEGLQLQLEGNFWQWLKWAQEDFNFYESAADASNISEHSKTKFGAEIKSSVLGGMLGGSAVSTGSTGISNQTPNSPVDLRGGGRLG